MSAARALAREPYKKPRVHTIDAVSNMCPALIAIQVGCLLYERGRKAGRSTCMMHDACIGIRTAHELLN